MSGLYFEELEVGSVHAGPGATVTEEAIIRFALEWDFQPFHVDARDPKRPDIPVMKDIGCPPTNPPNGMIIIAPAGLPDPIATKLTAAFKQVSDTPEFKKLLDKYNLDYAYEDGKSVQVKFPAEIEWYKKYFTDAGLTLR